MGDRTFASKAEARRYEQLVQMQAAGHVHSLELQPRFPVKIKGVLICTYVADFRYKVGKGRNVLTFVEDVKGVRTAIYKLKKKLVETVLGVEITEV